MIDKCVLLRNSYGDTFSVYQGNYLSLETRFLLENVFCCHIQSLKQHMKPIFHTRAIKQLSEHNKGTFDAKITKLTKDNEMNLE